MPVKIDPDIVEELQAMDLAIWEAKHMKHEVLNEKTGKMTLRENKNWVIVTIAGPGMVFVSGSGKTLREAVDRVLVHYFPHRVSGIKGKMMVLESELWKLFMVLMEEKYRIDPESLDDDIPF